MKRLGDWELSHQMGSRPAMWRKVVYEISQRVSEAAGLGISPLPQFIITIDLRRQGAGGREAATGHRRYERPLPFLGPRGFTGVART